MWIWSLLDDGDSLRTIAAKTGRNVSVISREVSRNARSSGVYDPLHADYTASTAGAEADLSAEDHKLKAQQCRVEQEREILRWAAAHFVKDVNTK